MIICIDTFNDEIQPYLGGVPTMKGKKAVLLIILIVLIGIAAVVGSITFYYQNNQTQNPSAMSMEGIVAIMEGQRILVVSGADADELKDQTEDEIVDGATEAIWFSLSIDQRENVNEFDEVRITYSKIDESFPGQAVANTINVLESNE